MADGDMSEERRKLEKEESAKPTDERTKLTEEPTVEFINGPVADGEASVVIDSPRSTDADGNKPIGHAFIGLTKEELMKFAEDPFWRKLRLFLFIGFWVIWLVMLVAAIIVIVLAPKCPERPKLTWWQSSLVYQVYPQSFKDGNNDDGMGDLKGLHENLGHLKKLKVNAVWLHSVYKSLMVDNGQDVINHKEIDESFGSMAEFNNLLRDMHKKYGMKLIMDFIPNHVSTNHTWFQSSRLSRNGTYGDYFIWSDGIKEPSGDVSPPNNWLSVYGHTAWKFDQVRGQWYYHTFSEEQPDLNLDNPKVLKDLDDILLFWLDKGVDGFVLRDAKYLIKSKNISADEPKAVLEPAPFNEEYAYLDHPFTTHQNGSVKLVDRWQKIVSDYAEATEKAKALIVETSGTVQEVMKYNSANLVLNSNLINIDSSCDGNCMKNLVQSWMSAMPETKWPSWMLGSPSNHRIATRKGSDYTKVMNILLLLLPGTPFAYYGDEIGMKNGQVAWNQTRDIMGKQFGETMFASTSRDFERTPMQWTGERNAGFSTFNTTWLPVAQDYVARNVRQQSAVGAGFTEMEVFMEISALRSKPSFQWGKMYYSYISKNIFSFVRQAKGFPGFLVVLNVGSIESGINFSNTPGGLVPQQGTVVGSTHNFDHNDFKNGTVISLQNVHLDRGQGLVVHWDAQHE